MKTRLKEKSRESAKAVLYTRCIGWDARRWLCPAKLTFKETPFSLHCRTLCCGDALASNENHCRTPFKPKRCTRETRQRGGGRSGGGVRGCVFLISKIKKCEFFDKLKPPKNLQKVPKIGAVSHQNGKFSKTNVMFVGKSYQILIQNFLKPSLAFFCPPPKNRKSSQKPFFDCQLWRVRHGARFEKGLAPRCAATFSLWQYFDLFFLLKNVAMFQVALISILNFRMHTFSPSLWVLLQSV